MLQLKVPHKEFATLVTAVLCTRLIRKLCDACKVGYAPTPDLLKKLGIPAGKIEALYRSPQAGRSRKAVQRMRRPRLQGRTAIFELLEVDDQNARGAAQEATARLSKKGGPRRWHAAIPRGRPAAGSQGAHVACRTTTRTKRIGPRTTMWYNIFYGIVLFAGLAMTVREGFGATRLR